MIKILFKFFFLIGLILFTYLNSSFSQITSKIIFKVNDQIITNIDIENERKFLLFLNPDLKNLSEEQIDNLSEDSIKNRKIKEIELAKYFDLNKNILAEKYTDNFIKNSGYKNKEEFKVKLKSIKLQFEHLQNNFLIDNLWREFVFNKFKSQVKIDTKNLERQIKNQDKEVEELNLSEILFDLLPDKSIEQLTKIIYDEIETSGFEAAASIYSKSDSKNFGGRIGWIKSNQISKKIYSEIINNNISSPIKTNNGYLIIKINERRKIKEEINFGEELSKLINIERDKELNKLGYIYFNKIKKRIFISEN